LRKYSADNKVTYYDNYGRQLKEAEKLMAPDNMTAEVVWKMYVQAIGGEKAVMDIKSIKTVSTSEVQNIPIVITEMKKAPGKYKETVEGTVNGQKMPFQKQVYNGTKGYQEQQGQKADMSADDLEEIKAAGRHSRRSASHSVRYYALPHRNGKDEWYQCIRFRGQLAERKEDDRILRCHNGFSAQKDTGDG